MWKALLILIFFASINAFAQAKLNVKDSKKNFGFVKQGEVLNLEYAIENSGNQALIINECKVACSCTSINFPQKPINPGEKAIIQVTFNTQSVYDRQDRIIEVYSNDPNSPHKLRFKGVVLKK